MIKSFKHLAVYWLNSLQQDESVCRNNMRFLQQFRSKIISACTWIVAGDMKKIIEIWYKIWKKISKTDENKGNQENYFFTILSRIVIESEIIESYRVRDKDVNLEVGFCPIFSKFGYNLNSR